MDFFGLKKNWSFTFTISVGKNVYYKGNNVIFSKLHYDDQYLFLEKRMVASSEKFFHEGQIYWVYEEHKDKPRLHIHGYVEGAYTEQMVQFQKEFYRFPIKYSEKTFEKISDIQPTRVNIKFFIDYMNKEQDNIKYRMSFIEDKMLHASLDGKKFKFKIEDRINDEYLRHLDDHLDKSPLSNDYPFGKNNKFVLEI